MGAEAQTQTAPAGAGARLSQAEFEALLTRAGETGAKSVVATMQQQAETRARAEADAAAKAKKDEEEAQGTPGAAMEQAGALGALVGTLDGIGNLNIPFGSVLVGAIPGVVVAELIDGFMPPGRNPWLNPVLKVGAGWVGVQYGRQLLGAQGAMFFAGALALQAMSQLLPIDQWVAGLLGLVRRTGVVAQAEAVVRQAHMGQFSTAGIGYYDGRV